MKFRPRNDRVLVRLDDESQESAGGLHIPENNRLRPFWGTVCASGPGTDAEDNSTHAGDRVLISWDVGQRLTIDGVEHLLVSESDILAVAG